MKVVFQVDMFAEADVAAEAAEVSNTASLANVEHHAHLTDNWDDAEGYYRVQASTGLRIHTGCPHSGKRQLRCWVHFAIYIHTHGEVKQDATLDGGCEI